MLVEKWMSRIPATISEDDSLGTALRILKERKIRRLPVLKEGKLVGIVTDRDLKAASPSRATSLDIWELHVLIEKLKIRDIMSTALVTIRPDDTIEKAARLMLEKKIGGLPVLDADGDLAGILTEADVFRALVEVTGANRLKTRISVLVPDQPGSIREIADICREKGGKILSILVSYAKVPEGQRELIMRVACPDTPALESALRARYSDVLVRNDD